jgi:hypothetical protein
MIIKICTNEGRTERCTETELPVDKSWEELQKFAISAIKTAYKYSDEKLPEGLIQEDLVSL